MLCPHVAYHIKTIIGDLQQNSFGGFTLLLQNLQSDAYKVLSEWSRYVPF